AIEEEVVEPIGKLVMMRNVALCARLPVDSAQQGERPVATPSDRLAAGAAALPPHIVGEEVEKIEDVAILDDELTVHIGFTDRQPRIARNVARYPPICEPHFNAAAAAGAIAIKFAAAI